MNPFAEWAAARQWVTDRVAWYHRDHCHLSIRFVTPAQRPAELDGRRLKYLKTVSNAACLRNPQRWRGPTRNGQRIHAVYLNPEHTHTQDNSPKEAKNQIQKAA